MRGLQLNNQPSAPREWQYDLADARLAAVARYPATVGEFGSRVLFATIHWGIRTFRAEERVFGRTQEVLGLALPARLHVSLLEMIGERRSNRRRWKRSWKRLGTRTARELGIIWVMSSSKRPG